MTPFWQDDHLTLYGGDCRAVLAELPAESVHCVVTSPPYYSLRDYGVAGQIGLEATLAEYVETMVEVFRLVRRVLRKDGTVWLNLGDAFGEKQLLGAPWRVAFALQADGWYLRSDIIWSKPNPMPESVTDRPTKAHEYLFLLSRSPRYYFDADAVREPHAEPERGKGERERNNWSVDGERGSHETVRLYNPAGRNLRSVWTIATEPYPGAHFATFPRKLVEPCVKAGTSERGVCSVCGAPWVRLIVAEAPDGRRGEMRGGKAYDADGRPLMGDNMIDHGVRGAFNSGGEVLRRETMGWKAGCSHRVSDAVDPVPAVVLDPFAGSGTTLLVAQSLGRRGIGIDLSPDYLKQALERNRQTPLGLVG